jgi:hypothetical protein
MAAAAILENGVGRSVLSFLGSACQYQSVYRISSKSVHKWLLAALRRFMLPGHAKMG